VVATNIRPEIRRGWRCFRYPGQRHWRCWALCLSPRRSALFRGRTSKRFSSRWLLSRKKYQYPSKQWLQNCQPKKP